MKTKKPSEPTAFNLGLGPIVETKSTVPAGLDTLLANSVGRFFKSRGKFYLVASISISKLDKTNPNSEAAVVAQVRELSPTILHAYKRVYGAKVELAAMLVDATKEAAKPSGE
jgi:hypothetical protein